MDRIRELYARKGSIWNRMQEIRNGAQAENRDLTSEEIRNWDAAHADLEAVAEQIRVEENTRDLELANRDRRPAGARDGGSLGEPAGNRGEGRAADYDRVFNTWVRRGELGLTDEERTILRSGFSQMTAEDGENRAMSEGTGSAGGYTVPSSVANVITETLAATNAVRRAVKLCGGEPLVTSDGRTINFATNNDTGNTGEIIAENTTETEDTTGLVFGQVPIGAYIYSSKFVRLSLALLEDTAVDLAGYLGRQLGNRISRIQNTHFTTGDNSSKPNGVVTAATAGVTAAGAAAIAINDVIGLRDSLDEAYRAAGKCAFMAKQSTITAIAKLQDSTGRPIWNAGLAPGQPDTLFGYPYVANPDMAAIATGNVTVLFGDFSKYQIRDVRGIAVVQARERYIELLQVAFLAYLRSDADLLDTAAVKKLTQA